MLTAKVCLGYRAGEREFQEDVRSVDEPAGRVLPLMEKPSFRFGILCISGWLSLVFLSEQPTESMLDQHSILRRYALVKQCQSIQAARMDEKPVPLLACCRPVSGVPGDLAGNSAQYSHIFRFQTGSPQESTQCKHHVPGIL
jgi:hypothetical protein